MFDDFIVSMVLFLYETAAMQQRLKNVSFYNLRENYEIRLFSNFHKSL